MLCTKCRRSACTLTRSLGLALGSASAILINTPPRDRDSRRERKLPSVAHCWTKAAAVKGSLPESNLKSSSGLSSPASSDGSHAAEGAACTLPFARTWGRWFASFWQQAPLPSLDVPGHETSLSHRYLGTSVERSQRSMALMSNEELSQVAAIMNSILDIAYFNEDQEQEIFEFAACQVIECIAQTLPNEFIRVVRRPGKIPDDLADMLETRLIELVRRELFMPFLDEKMFRGVVQCIVVLLVGGMRHGSHRLHEMSADEIRELRVRVFMKGVLDKFFEPEERKKLCRNVTALIKNVPFVPSPLLDRFSQGIITFVGEEIERGLFQMAHEYETAAKDRRPLPLLPHGVRRGLTAEEEELHKLSPFTMQLRRRTCELLEARLEDRHADRNVGVLGLCIRMLPDRFTHEFILWMLDLVFSAKSTALSLEKNTQEQILLMSRLESAMESAVSPYGGPPPCEEPELKAA